MMSCPDKNSNPIFKTKGLKLIRHNDNVVKVILDIWSAPEKPLNPLNESSIELKAITADEMVKRGIFPIEKRITIEKNNLAPIKNKTFGYLKTVLKKPLKKPFNKYLVLDFLIGQE
jgi:hypothetical protein